MEKLFLTVLNLSITASYLVVAVIVARWLLRKTPKSIVCYLWLLVGIRLICPFSVESAFSLLPKQPAFDNRQIFWNSRNENDTDGTNANGFNAEAMNPDNLFPDKIDPDSSEKNSLNQGNVNQGNVNQDNTNQDKENQDNMNQDNMNQDNANQDSMNQDSMNQDSTNQDSMNQDSTNQDSMNQDSMNQDTMNQDSMNQDSMNQDSMNQDSMNQDTMNKTGIRQSDSTQAITMFLPKIYRIASYFWIAGMLVMFVYFVVSWRRVQNKVRTAIPMNLAGTKYYQCDNISSPFLFGIVKPRIYVPSHIAKQELSYVLRHETAHRQRRDYMVKPISYLLLMVYWINPILWAAYILLCRDIELACDEQVVKEMGTDCKKAYSQALLTYSVSRSSIAACPVAFGEIGVKQRVKNILNYKKPTFWVFLAAAAAGIVITVCFMTKPKMQDTTDKNIAENTDNHENFATAENNKHNVSNNNKNIGNTENPKITENNKIMEMVDIQKSEIFHLSIPRDLADLLSFESLSDFALSIKTADRQAIIGIMCVMQAEDIQELLNNNEYYLIGTYGANNILASGKAADEALSDTIIYQENLELNLPDDIIRQEGLDIEGSEGIIRPEDPKEADEKGGVLPIPNADGTQKPEKLPNSDGGYTAGVIGEIKKESENKGSDYANSDRTNRFPNNFCYIFIPAKQTAWQAEKAQELQLLQDKVISLLETVEISEVGQLAKYQDITVNYFDETERAALEEERKKLESQRTSGTEAEKNALEEQIAKLNRQIELESQLAAVKQQIKDFTANEQNNQNTEESVNNSANNSIVQGADAANSNIVLHSKWIASKLKEDAQRLETYFPDHHEQQKEFVQSADLDGDGIDEKITMTNLMYNGGDGGYAISVKRNGTEIPMP